MKLRRIDILGFKSFRDRTTVDLSDGMTAVVGPNGCGKSNVVDAIKWAMGDMSAKSLRGQTMEDVIFAGSESRKPMGLAEVTLTFENDGTIGEDEIDWGDAIPRELREMSEIAVTRRLHRSGESEYLINKTPCRLMDIQNLLAGTGVGKQGYSIIEQNRVGFIVQAKPEERRLLIEEASGITRYKGQRDRAEKRLVRTEENLLRVDDVLSEVEKQIKTLERQARKAQQHRALTDELRALEVAILVARRDELDSERNLYVERCDAAEQAIEAARAAIAKEADSHDRARVDSFQAEKAHAEATEAFYRLDTTLNLARSRVEHATVALQEANRRLGSAEREAAAQRVRLEELTEEREKVQAELEGLGDLAEPESELLNAETSLESARKAAETARRESEDARGALERARSEIGRREERRGFFVRRRTELELRENALQTAVEEASKERDTVAKRVEALRNEVADLRERLGASKEREQRFEEARDAARTALEAREGEARQAQNRLRDLEARGEALSKVIARGDGLSKTLREVLSRVGERPQFHGTLADYLQVESGLEQAAANYLEGALLDVLVEDLDAAHALLDELGELEGRVAFRALDGRTAEAFANAVRDELSRAQLWDNGRVVTAEGRLVAGKTGTQSVLEQRRKLTELEGEIAQAREGFESAKAAEAEASEALRAAIQKADLSRRESETLRLELRTRETDCAAAERDLEKIDRAAQAARSEIVPILRARDELDAEEAENEERLEELAKTRDEAAGRLDALGDSDAELQEELERLRTDVTERKIAVASARERKRNLASALERTARSIESSTELLRKYDDETTQQSERIVELQATIKEGEAELSGAQGQRDEAKKAAEAARSKLETANATVASVEAKIRDRRAAIEKQVEERQELEFRQREASLGIAHIDEQLRDRFETELAAARALVAEIDTSPAERRGKRDYLRKRIESLGPVNAMAEDEYEGAKERFAFLTDQKADLEAAIADLRQAIAKMDRESRRRFKETFELVNAKFQEIFPVLFRGGRAELVLTNPDDLLNTGVDIQVQPPGKRLQSMTLLSGGEKALTAVSLIFSIFMLKPTPFSILDEVDAPLDEANVGRFARIVRRLSETSQMIVITHSRRTMEAADVLYGVTMEEPGVSKMVNVRLSEIDDRLAS